MHVSRQSGVLLHPTSLPGPYGMGDIGPEAVRFADTLQAMDQRLWQVLPLGPTGYGDSPYQPLSTFAGNHLLIGFDALADEGLLLSRHSLPGFDGFPLDTVDFGNVIPARMAVLHKVCREFNHRASSGVRADFGRFCATHAAWLDDYALYYAIKESQDLRPWYLWPAPLARRDPAALAEAGRRFADERHAVRVMQFLFHRQWDALRAHCRSRGVRIVGDIPIFVAHDSADVWQHPELFYLEPDGSLTVQAGVPPDYFSTTGQLWGNPLYRWDFHKATGYAWWIERMRHVFSVVDIVRIDHFRGFAAYWEIPGADTTAIGGRWVPGPGADLFRALRKALGNLPIIAEDLGVITPDVDALRDQFEFPGMSILQFAFGKDPKSGEYKPSGIKPNCVVYTGTHDNDTTVGWFNSEAGEGSTRTQAQIDEERAEVLKYFGTDGREIHWDMIKAALDSDAQTAVIPMQDLLGLGTEARMNLPGTTGGNWRWRLQAGQLTDPILHRLRALTRAAKRA